MSAKGHGRAAKKASLSRLREKSKTADASDVLAAQARLRRARNGSSQGLSDTTKVVPSRFTLVFELFRSLLDVYFESLTLETGLDMLRGQRVPHALVGVQTIAARAFGAGHFLINTVAGRGQGGARRADAAGLR